MNNKLTKTLSIVGTVLIWLPILAPLFFSAAFFIRARAFHFDYLMPAEFFLLVLVGGGLLIWAAWRGAYTHRKLIGWSLGVAIASLAACQTLAVVTGLASGATEPSGLPWLLVISLLAIYILAVIVCGIGGISITRSTFK